MRLIAINFCTALIQMYLYIKWNSMVTKTVWLLTFLEIFYFVFCWRKSVKWGWNFENTRV